MKFSFHRWPHLHNRLVRNSIASSLFQFFIGLAIFVACIVILYRQHVKNPFLITFICCVGLGIFIVSCRKIYSEVFGFTILNEIELDVPISTPHSIEVNLDEHSYIEYAVIFFEHGKECFYGYIEIIYLGGNENKVFLLEILSKKAPLLVIKTPILLRDIFGNDSKIWSRGTGGNIEPMRVPINLSLSKGEKLQFKIHLKLGPLGQQAIGKNGAPIKERATIQLRGNKIPIQKNKESSPSIRN